jgi:UDP-glucose-4-epimerase GalE
VLAGFFHQMSKGAILVSGGAGYIGSHTVRMLAEEAGYQVVVIDNLVFGHRDALVSDGVSLVEADIADEDAVEKIFSTYNIDGVVHFAAFCFVGESVTDPLKYYANNTAAPLTLLKAMRNHGCDKFILSSTCATYGDPQEIPMPETHPQQPINPYGHSKLMLERILRDCDEAYGLRSVRLRYFNASGCSLDGLIGEDHEPETHLIPNVLRAVKGEIGPVTVFGSDYPTADGTCIRDYVHVVDLARAHVRALNYLEGGGESFSCNLGTGKGASVKEVIDAAEAVTGKPVPLEFGERREGDPPELIADSSLAKELLGWEAEMTDIKQIIETAWGWMNSARGGKYRN